MAVKTKSRSLARLLQEDYLGSNPLRVDRDKGIIYGVKILGRQSRNRYGEDVEGTEYTPEAIKNARPLYEGIKVNCDHPPRDGKPSDRPVDKRLGKIFNVRLQDGELYGDLRALKSHPMYERLMEAAESMPDAFALSHVAFGKTKVEDGKLVVYEIREAKSVDVVADGATNKSLFESDEGTPMKAKTLRQVIESLEAKRKNPLLKLLTEMGEMGDTMGAAEVPAEPEKDPLDMLGEVVGALAAKKDAESFDLARKILAMLKPGGGGGEKKTSEADSDDKDKKKDDEKKVEDSLKDELDSLKLKDHVRELCEDLEFQPSRLQLKALIGLGTDDDRKAMVKELKESKQQPASSAGPRSSGPGRKLQESRVDEVKDAKGFATLITS